MANAYGTTPVVRSRNSTRPMGQDDGDEMGNAGWGGAAAAPAPAEGGEFDESGGAAFATRAAPRAPQAARGAWGAPPSSGEADGEIVVGEVQGEEVSETVEVGNIESNTENFEEVASADGREAGEEFAEASAEQLAAAESNEEGAFSDLLGMVGGMLGGEAQDEAQGDGESDTEGDYEALPDASEAAAGEQAEFLPFLAALVPTLVSAVGPMVAKAVSSRLSPRAKQVLTRLPAIVRPPAGPARPGPGRKRAGPSKDAILAMIAKLLKSAEAQPMTGQEGGMEVDEAFVIEAAAALEEAIVDYDDRKRITKTRQIPWRRICALRITFPSGSSFRGTGFLIGPRTLATAGHCVYMHDQGGWARSIQVIPGCNGTSHPFGQAESRSFRSVKGWVQGKRPESDMGCIILPAGAFSGHNLGSFGFASFASPVLLAAQAIVAGYPGSKPFAQLWGARRLLKTVTPKTLVYNTATEGGQSGAPVYIKRGGQRYVVGIHNYGASTGNSATRVTAAVAERLRAWSRL